MAKSQAILSRPLLAGSRKELREQPAQIAAIGEAAKEAKAAISALQRSLNFFVQIFLCYKVGMIASTQRSLAALLLSSCLRCHPLAPFTAPVFFLFC